MAEKQLTTLLEILNFASELLKKNSISEPRLNAELLLANVLNCKRLELYLDFEKPLNKSEKELYKIYLKRKLNREPLQYIVGNTNFYGYDIFVDSSVLIPRPDTEILVEYALDSISKFVKENLNILEIGTGSGCIAVALLSEFKKRKISYSYTGIDISETALNVAQKNIDNYKLENVNLVKNDFLNSEFYAEKDYDFIISNPPYVSLKEYMNLEPEVRDFEPKEAVTDFEEGFKFYKKLFKAFSTNTANYFLEIPYDGKEILEALLRENGIDNYSFYRDYNNNYRVLKILR